MTSAASRIIMAGTALAAALAMAGCATAPGTDMAGAIAPHATPAETAAMAATYRYLFANNASSLHDQAATYCVAVGIGADLIDPSHALVASLSDVAPKVRPVSTCKRQERAVDAQGRSSLIFSRSPLGCETMTSCLFNGGYYEGNVSASGGNYHARLVDGSWQVQPWGSQAVS